MAGQFFEHESQVSYVTCGCTVARDESDHSTPEKHWQSSVYVKQCDLHKSTDSTAVEAQQHAMTVTIATNKVLEFLPPSAFKPIFKEDAVPVTPDSGKTWVYQAEDVSGKVPLVPVIFSISPKDKLICVFHQDADAAAYKAAEDELAAHPYANLALADQATALQVFTTIENFAKNLATEQEMSKPFGFELKAGAVLVKPSANATLVAAIAEVSDAAIIP